ncbi:Kinesin- motor protein [Entomophthora muscae]|uniref:Kinesin- motor protein n=1 Tax=Entomophthora muscae TaxID=34485 RepID=A0ACC2T9A5_9FUNG|nr:Kinesin- motor protein [Entomophthora muscae]
MLKKEQPNLLMLYIYQKTLPRRSRLLMRPMIGGSPHSFGLIKFLGPKQHKAKFFDTVVSPILDEVLLGFNCTVFAYGQTGTGKTYTMEGDLSSEDGELNYKSGIIPRTLHELFKRLGDDHNKYTVRLSMLELYNEEVGDLLSLGDSVPKLTLNIDASSKLQIQGMEEISIEDTASGIALLQSGSSKRHTAATNCNQKSSRSHCIFTITVRIKESNFEGQDLLKEGKLYLVDLAGSEDTKMSGAINQQAREAGLINTSLLSLGRVITNLVAREESNAPIHIPYRESKLTRILQDSLGGQTKTCIIATISPAKISLEETVSTLKYATKAMKITNTPVSNQKMTSNMQITDLKSEIATLRSKLQAAYDKNGICLDKASYNDLLFKAQQGEDGSIEMRQEIQALKAASKRDAEIHQATVQSLARTKARLDTVSQKLLAKANECREKTSQLLKTQHLLEEEKTLKEAYCFTETKLDVVASNLVKDMNHRIGDIWRLQENIERKMSVSERNKHTLKILEETVANEVGHLHAKLEVFKLEQQALSKSFKGIMESLRKDLTEANVKNTSESLEKESAILASLAALDEALETHINSSKTCLDNLASECEAGKASFVAHLGDICSDLKLNLQTLTQESQLFKEELVKQKESLLQVVEGFKTQLQTQLAEQRLKLHSLSSTMLGQDSIQIQVLKEQVQSLQAVITEYRQKEPELIQHIKHSLAENLKVYSNLGERLREASELASQMIDGQTVDRERISRANTEALGQCQSDLADIFQSQTQASTCVLDHLHQSHATVNNYVDQSLVTCQLSCDRIHEMQASNLTSASAKLAQQTDLIAKHQLNSNELHLLKNESVQALGASIATICQDFRSHTYSLSETALSYAESATTNASRMEEQIQPFVAQCASIASTCQNQTHETISCRLQDDKPSGNTPKPNKHYRFQTEWERTDAEAAKSQFRQVCPEPASPVLDLSLGSISIESIDRSTGPEDTSRSSTSSRASNRSRSGQNGKRERPLGNTGNSFKPKVARGPRSLYSPSNH